ncbi:MAG: DUF3467 domain-containing protein [Bacteroidales bacterium]|nr:DUF3467 domain-containing protein [Bacteroidales bacterium]
MENNKDNKQINIDLKPEVARGCYSNLAIISHSHSEFILDFATVLPGLPKPEVGSRILMTPEHTKRLLNALAENIGKYEAQFGPIVTESPRATFNLTDLNPNGPKS